MTVKVANCRHGACHLVPTWSLEELWGWLHQQNAANGGPFYLHMPFYFLQPWHKRNTSSGCQLIPDPMSGHRYRVSPSYLVLRTVALNVLICESDSKNRKWKLLMTNLLTALSPGERTERWTEKSRSKAPAHARVSPRLRNVNGWALATALVIAGILTCFYLFKSRAFKRILRQRTMEIQRIKGWRTYREITVCVPQK
jgi:hypothetical protein